MNNANIKLVWKLAIFAIGMFGFGYGLVPLYDVLCEATGLNGKTEGRELSNSVDLNRDVNIEFVTALNKSTPIDFTVETKKLQVHPGEFYTVNFLAENKVNRAIKARAIYSISPGIAGEFLTKIKCFCEIEQEFGPKEHKILPIRFTVNPKLPVEYKTLTLAYTFFDITEKH